MVENYKSKYFKLTGGETTLTLFVNWIDTNNEKKIHELQNIPVSTTYSSIINMLPDNIKSKGDVFYGPVGMSKSIQKYNNDDTLTTHNIQTNSQLHYRNNNII